MAFTSALVNLSTGLVENIIIADPALDLAPDDHIIIGRPPAFVKIGTKYLDGKFIDPGAGMTSPTPIKGLKTL